jgi:hypothetical protein
MTLAYAVIPRCSDTKLSLLDMITTTESHELVEACTDPLPDYDGAYGSVDESHFYYGLGGASELADMCEADESSYTTFSGLPYMVQRSWSNAAASAGRDPCEPELPGEIYFNASPAMKDTLNVQMFRQSLTAPGVQLSGCAPRVVEVDLYSEGPLADWTVSAEDLGDLQSLAFGGGPGMGGSALSLSFDKTTGHNGDKLHLTISATMSNPGSYELFRVVSTSPSGEKHDVLGLVGL